MHFDYDRAGRLTAEHGAEGTVRYTLDDLDNLTTLKLPHGQHIDVLTYGSGHVHQIRSGEQVISDFERDDLHREVMYTQGQLTQRIGYDQLGRRSWQSADNQHGPLTPGQGRLWRSYRYNPAGELAQQQDALRGTIHFQYDAVGHLQRQTRQDEGRQEDFAWDAAGNLLDDIARKSKGYVEGNRLKVWQDLRFEYDPWGNLSMKRKGAHQAQRYHFDADDRLVAVQTESARGRVETRFEYDPLGRRVKVTHVHAYAGGSTRVECKRFVWQGLRMVQEVREHGVSSYIYDPDAAYTPLARLDTGIGTLPSTTQLNSIGRRSHVYYFHTDLVGAPLEVTDEAGELAWAGKYSAWGKADMGEEAAMVPRIDQPLRYPGQYADDHTGLHYNTFRFYDPDIGRFISQDPIGLVGGPNLYAYAPNPTGWMDPLGWLTFPADSPDLFPVTGNQKNIVEITMQGSRSRDFSAAYKAAGIRPADAKNYTWHHVDDFNPKTGTTTMQLVKTDGLHRTPHKGSVYQFESHFDIDYDTREAIELAGKRGWLTGRPLKPPKAGC